MSLAIAPSKASAQQVKDMIEAIRWARFALHCELLGYEALPDTDPRKGEGEEMCGQQLVDLARAVAPFAPDQVACSGCADRHVLYGPAREIAAKAAADPKHRRSP